MIHYLIGDATAPQETDGLRVIAHICNNLGGWGSGFVVALSNKWPQPEAKYRELSRAYSPEEFLGEVQMVSVKDEHGTMFIANMVAQDGYTGPDNPVAVSYEALIKCLIDLSNWVDSYATVQSRIKKKDIKVSIHMPRIGCGLGGGSWDVVEPIISGLIGEHDIYVYDLPQ